jgi:LmbE family N-acetylglucosaminyl deacetylase
MKTSAHRAPAIVMSLAFSLTAALPLAAQLTPQQDPANLAGERVSAPDLADTLPLNHGAPALQQLLRKLRTRASFMLIVAHPDDEDNGALTYLSRGQGARVATLTLNRGEGGQNLMSADFDDALGLIRTQELLAADRTMDVDQFFGTEVDFGFSKTKEEAFSKWTHERVLYDAVRAIRLYRPLVIASVFIGEPSDGHGQHQVAGEIAQEAFNAAGDPSVFPDQIAAGLEPWQPLKVYARAPFGRIDAQGMYDYATSQYVPARFTNYVTGKVTDTVPKANVTVPEGDTDPLLGGESYAQLGRTGRALQKSQIGGGGGGQFGGGGRFEVSYHRYGSKLNQPDGDDSGLESGFFDGIDTTLPGIATLAPEVSDTFHPALEKIDRQIAEAQRLFDPATPELTAPPLRIALGALDDFLRELENGSINDLPPAETYNLLHELHIKRVQLNNALILAEGITVQAVLDQPESGQHVLTTQKEVFWKVKISNNSDEPVSLPHGKTLSGTPQTALAPHSTQVSMDQVELTALLPATRPYFSRSTIEQPFYDISDPALRNAPATPAPLVDSETFDEQGILLEVEATVAYASGPHKDEAVAAIPPVSVSVASPLGVITPIHKSISVTTVTRIQSDDSLTTIHRYPSSASLDAGSRDAAVTGILRLSSPPGWKLDPPFAQWKSHVASNEFSDTFSLTSPQISSGKSVNVPAIASYDGHDYSEGYRPVGYPGLTYTNYYTPATLRIIPVDVHTPPNLNIAYIPGTGDDVPAALDQLGVHPHILTAANLTAESLKSYDAVVLGVRAYEHRELAAANAALNQYASEGGVVIAQYNTGRLPEGTGPYPLDLGGSEKVVEEDSPVKIVAPSNPLLTWPNRITTADFNGWVEERGHGFMATWDPHYTPLFETHDAGQQPQLGGLLVARTGRGAWIYLGLALYRQLPEGVPGAYRLFANLISAAKNPAFQPR